MASRQLAIGPLMGLGACAGLLAATQLGTAEDGPQLGLALMLGGALAGAAWSLWRLPDAPVCRAPRLLGGCGGSNAVRDTAGNSRPKPPCWAHPNSKPKRVVNLLIVLAEVALGVGLLLALTTYSVGR